MTSSKAIGRSLCRKCNKRHEHQPLLDGRAKDAARYPPALCSVISRGIAKGELERGCNVTAMMTIEEGPHTRHIDAEDSHVRDEVDIPALIRKIEDAEDKSRV